MQESVKRDRQFYLGGSDIPIIMNLSPFKTRWQLLNEKAGLEPMVDVSNKYTTYGNVMEEKIRAAVNEMLKRNFVEGKFIIEPKDGKPLGIRCHTDGEDDTAILEIKTTSDRDGNRKAYLMQLCFYMMAENKHHGILAVYDRPEDMSEELDLDRLHIEYFSIEEFRDIGFVEDIGLAVHVFMSDLARKIENPFLTEQDFLPAELVNVANQIITIEEKLAELKAQENKIKADKKKLYEAMAKANVKSWETPNGYLITRVDGYAPSTKEVEDFDSETFEKENPDIYKKYCKKVTIKVSGKSGYALITPPNKRKGKKKE